MTTKTVDSKGRLALGSAFAGQLVLIDDSDPEKIIIQRAKAIPRREAWLYESDQALSLVRDGVNQARGGQFSVSPPDLQADAAYAAALAD